MTLKRGYTPVLRIIQRWRKTPYWRRARRPAAERGSVQFIVMRPPEMTMATLDNGENCV